MGLLFVIASRVWCVLTFALSPQQRLRKRVKHAQLAPIDKRHQGPHWVLTCARRKSNNLSGKYLIVADLFTDLSDHIRDGSPCYLLVERPSLPRFACPRFQNITPGGASSAGSRRCMMLI